MAKLSKAWSLVPLLVFVVVFLSAGIILGDFYKFPSPIAATLGLVVAFIMYRKPLNEKMDTFLVGCGQPTIITMCIIYLLAGGFAAMAKSIGSVDAIVYYGANYLSLRYLYAGTFLIAAFLSFSSGTSVGCIATLAPAVVGFTDIPTVHTPLLAAALLGGAMFGDNLSFISDTTIAATQTQDCSMKDKFRTNSRMAIPAAVITLIILVVLGFYYHNTNPDLSEYVSQSSSIWLIVPYLAVIILAIIGLNVFVVLFLGIVATMIFAFAGGFDLLQISQTVYEGFTGMTEIFLLSMLTGGLAYMVEKEGGIQYIFELASKFINTKFKAKTGISLLTGVINSAVANNTVAILIVAPIAKKISDNFKISPKNTASLLDITACIVQGLIPYGAQVLLLIKLTGNKVSYVDLVAQAYYLWILGIVAIIYFKWISRKKYSIS